MRWTSEKVETLKELRLSGLNARDIAGQIGGVSRDAVLVKLSRLGISRRVSDRECKTLTQGIAVRASGPDYYKSRSFNPKSHGAPSNPYVPERHASPSGAVSFKGLNSITCRLPVGDGTGLNQMFCGAECGPEDTYCKAHHDITHTPMKSRFPVKVGDPDRPYAPSIKKEF